MSRADVQAAVSDQTPRESDRATKVWELRLLQKLGRRSSAEKRADPEKRAPRS